MSNITKMYLLSPKKSTIIGGLSLILGFSNLLTAQNIGVKTSEPATVLDVNGSVAYREGTPLSVSNGTNNNIAVDSMSVYRITAPTAAFTITGFTGGANGRILTIINATSYAMTLAHENTSSTAANRIRTGTGQALVIEAGGTVMLQYNDGISRWYGLAQMGATAQSQSAWSTKGNTGTTAGTNFIGTGDAQDFVFKTSGTEWMRLTTAGNLGIGTTTPLSMLNVVRTDNSPACCIVGMFQNLSDSGTNGIGIYANSGNTRGAIVTHIGSNANFGPYPNNAAIFANSNNGMLILGTGAGSVTNDLAIDATTKYVGIGTITPAVKLQVGTSGDGTVARANAWNTFSDSRYKRHIAPLNSSLALVSQLRGTRFEWIKSGKKDIGFIAQEVETVLPEIVETDAQGYKSVDYAKINAVLVEAVKEQQTEINRLKADNQALQQDIQDLKRLLEAIQTRLNTISPQK